MTPQVRLIDTGVKPARWNVAMTAALADLHRLGSCPNTLRFHRYVPSVLIGRHQHFPDRPRRAGLEIARRVTGGGSVYMNPGILAWDIVASRQTLHRTLEQSAESVTKAVAAGLSELGVCAEFRPPNDVLVAGLKVSGSSGRFEVSTLVLQGTVIVDCDIADMAKALGLAAEPLKCQVGSLTGLLGRMVSIGEARRAVLAGLSRSMDIEFSQGSVALLELELVERLLEEIGTDAFVFGERSRELEPT